MALIWPLTGAMRAKHVPLTHAVARRVSVFNTNSVGAETGMSSGAREVQSFFQPLRGKTATFVLEGRQANLVFARTIIGLLAHENEGCAILDLDAFYSSSSLTIFSHLAPAEAQATTIRVPEPGSDVEEELSRIFAARQSVMIIDSLNSLYHLISTEDGKSKSRKLSFAVAGLSYFARTNGKAVILTMYRRERLARSGTTRSISNLSDLTASVDVSESELTAKSDRGPAWPGGKFSIRIP